MGTKGGGPTLAENVILSNRALYLVVHAKPVGVESVADAIARTKRAFLFESADVCVCVFTRVFLFYITKQSIIIVGINVLYVFSDLDTLFSQKL